MILGVAETFIEMEAFDGKGDWSKDFSPFSGVKGRATEGNMRKKGAFFILDGEMIFF